MQGVWWTWRLSIFLFWWETEEVVICQDRLKGVMLGIGARPGKRDAHFPAVVAASL